jgi:hypothetical protein
MNSLPPYVSREIVQERLLRIFPEGTPFRNYCTREIAGSTVFAMLYIGAIEESGRFLGPKHVYRMSDEQAALSSDNARVEYAADVQKAGSISRGRAWYADTTREPIRDETLRQGLISAGAALDRKDLATTSSKPRYSLTKDFAALFNPALGGEALDSAIERWRKAHLSASALARIEILRAGATLDPSGIEVEFPNREVRRLSAGQSSIITKAVVEEFAPRFLQTPAVLWLSESGNKVVARDDLLAKRIHLHIDPSRNLPDIILVDTGRPELLLVFVEVVATDGPISEDRRAELLALATDAGFDEKHVAFVTAFMDREATAFRKAFASLAWNSFAWVAGEPDRIVALMGFQDLARTKLHDVLALAGSSLPE